jgi:hypothetical protein
LPKECRVLAAVRESTSAAGSIRGERGPGSRL